MVSKRISPQELKSSEKGNGILGNALCIIGGCKETMGGDAKQQEKILEEYENKQTIRHT